MSFIRSAGCFLFSLLSIFMILYVSAASRFVFLVGCGSSGLWILLHMTFEVAVVDNVWCECVAEVVGEFFSLFFVASCPSVICFSDCRDGYYWLPYFFRGFP